MAVLTFIGALGSAVIAGVFFAFSSFVMAALGRLPAQEGMAAMRSINVTVLNPVFLGVLMGTGLLCVALCCAGYFRIEQIEGKLILAAGLIYVIGCIGITIACNVPLNDALARAAPDAVDVWARFRADWTNWNHVRAVAALLSAVSLTAALVASESGRIDRGASEQGETPDRRSDPVRETGSRNS